MAKTWVLDSETKGTGAHVAPIEERQTAPRKAGELALVTLGGPPAEPRAAPQPRPLRFKVVDVMSAQTVAEGVAAREAVAALEAMHSVLDARIFRWDEDKQRWRLLSLAESKALWSFRGRIETLPAAGS
jgi:hypothetical protein